MMNTIDANNKIEVRSDLWRRRRAVHPEESMGRGKSPPVMDEVSEEALTDPIDKIKDLSESDETHTSTSAQLLPTCHLYSLFCFSWQLAS